MMSVRDDILILDATLRDGGLVNNFEFTDEFVKALYEMNVAAGVDYMEMGYRASKKQFKEDEFGKWKFSSDDDIRKIVGDNDTSLKLSIMADVGRCDYKTDIVEKTESPVDMIRVATYMHQIPEAIDMILDADHKGYETTCNIMAISNAQESDVQYALDELAKTPVKAVYVVDSYGSLFPIQMRRITELYLNVMEKHGKMVGIHAHNNQQCAFANTIESMSIGANMLDATVCGMGRGAGNCALEGLIGFLKNPKYKLEPVLEMMEKYMVDMRKKYTWGYDVPYLLTGLCMQHPRTAIAAVKNNDTHYADFYRMLNESE
jgi:4-hydroxy 2-oxovalerate aldolase